MKLKREWRVLFKKLKYSPILDEERELDSLLTTELMLNESVMEKIAKFHKEGQKCAVVTI